MKKWFCKKLIRDGPLVLAIFLSVLAIGNLVPINDTASMPFGLYLRLPAWNLEVGDLVELDNPFYNSFGVKAQRGLLKRIVNKEGEMYEVQGENELSYDSTYFGLVGEEYIKHKLIEIWTFSCE